MEPLQVFDEAKPYVEEFKNEAYKRGLFFDMDGWRIETVDSIEDNKSLKGKCYINEMLIKIDREYFFKTDQFHQKALLFHEFGHCFLMRKHKQNESFMINYITDLSIENKQCSESCLVNELFEVTND